MYIGRALGPEISFAANTIRVIFTTGTVAGILHAPWNSLSLTLTDSLRAKLTRERHPRPYLAFESRPSTIMIIKCLHLEAKAHPPNIQLSRHFDLRLSPQFTMPMSHYRLNKAESKLNKGRKEVAKEVDATVMETYTTKLDEYVPSSWSLREIKFFSRHQKKVDDLRKKRDKMKLTERLVDHNLKEESNRVRSEIKDTRHAYRVRVLYIYGFSTFTLPEFISHSARV